MGAVPVALGRSSAAVRRCIIRIAACLWAVAGYGELPPISAFTDPSDYGTVAISPTGEYLALTMRHEDGATFRVVTYPDNEIKVNRNFSGKRGGREIADLLWVADKHVVVFPANSRGAVEGVGRTGELMVVPVEGGIVRRLGWGAVLDVLPDDPAHILIQTARDRFLEAYKVNVVSPRTRTARNPLSSANRVGRGAAPWGSLMPDHAGEITFSTGQTANDQTEVYYREGRRDWQLVESHGYAEQGWTPLRYAGKSGKYYTFDSRGAATVGLGLYDAAANSHDKIIVRHPTVDVGSAWFDFGGQNLWAVGFEHHYPAVVYVLPDHPLARTHAMLRKTYPDDLVIFTSSSRDHSTLVALITGDRKPGDFVMVNVKSKTIDPLVSRRPRLQPDMLSPMQPVEFQVRDGFTIYGYVTSHPDAKKPGPMVVLVHGGPHQVRDRWGFHSEAQLLASRGYHVLQVNFRGSGGYGNDYMRVGFGEWGGMMQDDVTDATRWAIEAGIADPERVCIYGGSYGAYSALMGAVREPALYRCAIGTSGLYDLSLVAKVGDIRARRSGIHYLRRVLGANPELRKARSPVYQAERIEAAVMIAHGGLDRRTPIVHGRRMRDALREAGKEVDWYTDSNQGHGFTGKKGRREYFEHLLGFLDKHIGDGSRASQTAATVQ